MFSSETQTGYKGHSGSLLYSFSSILEQFQTRLKEKRAVKEENLIPLEINLANLKSDMERIIKTIRRMTWPSELQSNKGKHCLV